ncbi:hypothetical protein BKA70DRAFT_1431387 [Coprinopsis sp. MPI-PUGE-AT-0042]|nr:hypothetical protein BKA70DRAFT_1431387 [Coprinopsis sp. MPI-PUGE-AT-0042]
MFRAALKRTLSARPMTSGLASSFRSSAPAMSKKVSLHVFVSPSISLRNFGQILTYSPKYNPKDWVIVPSAPGDQELMFANVVDNTMTWYTPEGMTAAEIMQIPDAKEFLKDEEGAEFYIKKMAEEKKRDQENGVFQD